jgi:hypothetical protein
MNVGDLELYRKENMNSEMHDSDEAIVHAHVNGKNRAMYKTIEFKYGKVGLMCPHCFNFMIRMVKFTSSIMIENEEPTDVEAPELWMFNSIGYSTYQCKFCGEYEVTLTDIDVNIVEAISKLNKKGYRTKFSCEGHGEHLGYIYFENNSISEYFHTLPITWYPDIEDFRTYGRCIIRSDACNYIEGLSDLNEWVDSLPENSYVSDFKEPEFSVASLYPSIQIDIQNMMTQDTVNRILTNMGKQTNSAVYGALRAFGYYHR